jgi:hypothetical protein
LLSPHDWYVFLVDTTNKYLYAGEALALLLDGSRVPSFSPGGAFGRA